VYQSTPHTYTRVGKITHVRCLNLKRDIMRVTSTKSRKFPVVIAAAVTFQAAAVNAQHAADNPISAADDAYGLTLRLESVGLYSPGLVRGFNPQAAGNVQIDGLYIARSHP
jgi:iron complex outermembrane recepter protein